MKNIYLLTHTDLDGYGSDILSHAFGLDSKIVHLENTAVDDYVIKLITSFESENVEIPETIYITDLGLKPDTAKMVDEWLNGLPQEQKPTFLLFDHHGSALHLNQYDWSRVVVEKNGRLVSGTSLFFHYLYNELKLPIALGDEKKLIRLVNQIRMYDVWEWKGKTENPKYLNDLFYLIGPKEFVDARLKWLKGKKLSLFTDEEKRLLHIENKRIEKYLERKADEMVVVNDFFKKNKDAYFNVGVVQVDMYHSELGNYLCDMNQDIDFVVLLNLTNNKVSMRTNKEDVNLFQLAKELGGGGHKKAAGAPLESLGMNFIGKVYEKTLSR